MATDNLKPCPFCGSKDLFEIYQMLGMHGRSEKHEKR